MTETLAQAAAERPFVGLAPFTEDEARYFFGRDADRAVIVSNMVASRLTVLYGPSGCGKSSLLEAGVLNEVNKIVSPRQIAEHGSPEFVVTTFHEWRDRPRDALLVRLHERIKGVLERDIPAPPVGISLADGLATLTQHVRGALLIVLDQFEEYFLYHGRKVVDGKFALELAGALNRADLRANFLISIREDVLAQLDALEGYVPNLMANTLRLDRLDRQRGRDAISGPINRYNELRGNLPPVTIEPALIDEVLTAVEAGSINLETTGRGRVDREDSVDSDARPIEAAFLQLVMNRLWEAETARGSQVLRCRTFHELGGAERIVGTHLDTVMNTFAFDRRALAAELFRYLVTPTGTKIALTLNDMVEYTGLERERVEPVLAQLGSRDVRILREVKGPLDDQSTTRHEIFHDVLAGVILDWRRRYSTEQAKRDAARKAETERLEESRKAEQRRREEVAAADAARRRAQIRAVGSLLCVTTVLSTVAIYQAIQAGKKAKIANERTLFAKQQEKIADDERTAANDAREKADYDARKSESSVLAARAAGVLEEDPDLSLALALAAIHRQDTSAARFALRQALGASRVRAMVGSLGGDSMTCLAYSRDGQQLATIRRSGHLQIRNMADSKITHDIRLELAQASPRSMAFGDQGHSLTILDDRGAITVVGLSVPAQAPQTTPSHSGKGSMLFHALAPDASQIAIATDDHRIHVWDTRAKKFVLNKSIGKDIVTEVAFDPMGKVVAIAVDSPSREGAIASAVSRPQGANNRPAVAGPPEAPAVATRFKVRFVQVSDGRELTSIACDEGPITALEWGGDGRRLAIGTKSTPPATGTTSTSPTGRVQLWERDGGKWAPGRQIQGRGQVSDLAFESTAAVIAIAWSEGSAQIWDCSTGYSRNYLPLQSAVSRVVFSPNDDSVLVQADDNSALIWPVSFRSALRLRGHTGEILDAAFAPDGLTVVTASADGTARIWDAALESPSVVAPALAVPWSNVVFTPGGKELIIAGADNQLRVVNAENGKLVGEPHSHPSAVIAMDLSPDGLKLATAGSDKVARVLELSSWKTLSELRGHAEALSAVVFSPDGRSIATASHDKTVRVFDANSGKEIGVLPAGNAPVTGLAYRQDGTRLATTALDDTFRLWDTKTFKQIESRAGYASRLTSGVFDPDGRIITGNMGLLKDSQPNFGPPAIVELATGRQLTLTGHDGVVLGATVSPDGSTVATAGTDRTVRLWNASTGEARGVLYGHGSFVINVVFSSKGSYLASEAYDDSGIIWDVKKSLEMFRLPGLTSTSSVLAFDPQESRLATTDRKFNINLWDIATGTIVQTLEGHPASVSGCTFSADGKTLASTSTDGTVRIWELESGESQVVRGQSYQVSGPARFSPDGRELAVVCSDFKVRVWDARGGSGEPRALDSGGVTTSIAYDRSGARLAAGCSNGSVWLLDATGKSAAARPLLNVKQLWSNTSNWLPAFSPDGTLLLTSGSDSTARLWDVKSQSVVREISGIDGFLYAAKFSPDGRLFATSSVKGKVSIQTADGSGAPVLIGTKVNRGHELLAFSPDGSMLAVGNMYLQSGNVATVWNTKTGAQVHELREQRGSLTQITFSPDGKQFATSGTDSAVHVYRTDTFEQVREITLPAGGTAYQLSFSPDGERLATAGYGGNTAAVWEIKTGKKMELPFDAPVKVHILSFSPDGKLLVSADETPTARVWDAQSGKPLHQLHGAPGTAFFEVEWSRDGKYLLAASNYTVVVWNVEKGELSATLNVGSRAMACAFSSDGSRILTTDQQNAAKVWDARSGRLISELGNVVRSAVEKLEFSDRDDTIISGHADGSYAIWDAKYLRLKQVQHTALMQSLSVDFDRACSRAVFAQGGRPTFGFSGQSSLVEIWEEGHSRPKTLDQNGPAVVEAAFGPDGKHVYALRADGTVRIWDTTTYKMRSLGEPSYLTGGGAIPDADLGTSGKLLAISIRGGKIGVWTFESGKLFTTFTGPQSEVLSLRFNPDRSKLAAIFDDGITRVFDVIPPIKEVISKAEGIISSLNRKLSEADVNRYLTEGIMD